jgi:hypothetical protein
MNTPNLKTVKDASSARQALAAVIKERADLVARHERVAAAHELADETVRACTRYLNEAEANLEGAKANESYRLAAAALGEEGGMSTESAVAALAKAQNDLAIAKATRGGLQERIEREVAAVDRATQAVNDGVRSVVQASVPVAELLDEAEALRKKFLASRATLLFLLRDGLGQEADERTSIDVFLAHPFLLPEMYDGWRNHVALAPWKRALAALEADSEVPLPV